MSSTQLIDLPTELLHEVFDRLPAYARIRLNAALPKSMTIRGTLKTNLQATKKLGIMVHALKRHTPKGMSFALLNFLQQHKYEPTLQDLYDTAKSEWIATLEDIMKVDKKDAFLNAFKEVVMKNDHAAINTLPEMPQIEDGYNSFFYEAVEVFQKMRPEIYDALSTHPKTQTFMKHMFHNMSCTIMYKLINYQNEALLSHVYARRAEIPEVDMGLEGLLDLENSTPPTFAHSIKSLKLYIHYCHPPREVLLKYMDCAIQRVHVEMIELLERHL